MPVSVVMTLPNSSPVAMRSVGFCEGVRTRCSPSAPKAGRAAPSDTSTHSATSPRMRGITGGECTIARSVRRRPSRGWGPAGRGADTNGGHERAPPRLHLGPAPRRRGPGGRAPGGDALKGKALLLFRRVFTDRRRPAEGDVLDREGQIPQSYAAERAPTAFERELWARFWELANDPDEARRRGVRALHGEAVSTRLRKDRTYTITLRSTGELTIQPTQ